MSDRQSIAVVTGAASGIGLTVAQALAARNARVMLCDRDAGALERAAAQLGPPHEAHLLDITDEAAIAAVLARIARAHGGIDLVINSAGITDSDATPAEAVDPALVERILQTNLVGTFLVSRAAARIMGTASGGRGGAIVNLSSLIARRVLPGRTPYAMSKGALVGMTRALACEWAEEGIRVNAVLPGYVDTPLVGQLADSGAVDRRAAATRIPLGRMAQPEEVAAAVLLAAEATYMTGAEVTVDGGLECAAGPVDTPRTPGPPPAAAVGIVTGGASGIGAATADRLASKGMQIVVFDRDPEAIAALPAGRTAFQLDITDDAALAQAVAEVERLHGRIDVLVNNAAIADDFRPSVDQTRARFERGIAVNLAAPLHVARHVAPVMARGGGGTIVNLSSIAARGGLPRRGGYCAAKAGIETLTRSLACEWAALGIRVNAVAPGYIATPGVAMLEESGLRSLDAIRRRIPLGRLGAPDEIAQVIAFLTSRDASYMTGAVLAVDGGWSAYGDAADLDYR